MRRFKPAAISEIVFIIMGDGWFILLPREYTGNNPIAPGDIHGLAIVIMIMSLLLMVRPNQKKRSGRKRSEEKAYKPLFITITATVLYVGILELIGFLPSTMLLLFGLSMYFSKNKWRVCLPYSVGFTVFLYLFFREFLGVLLPRIPFF